MNTARVVVVGAGIAGLTAAYALRAAAPRIAVTVIDGADRIGGKLVVRAVAGMDVDVGAEAMLARAPDGIALATELGLGGQIVHPATTSASIFVGGALRPVPGGTVLGVPSDVDALRRTSVLTESGIAAVQGESTAGRVVEDASVGSVVGSRMGREVVDRLVDPLLGGVYAGRADVLSLCATMPALAAQLRDHDSVGAAARAVVAAAAPRQGPVFATLQPGLGVLPAALAAASGATIELRNPVREIARTPGGFRIVAGPVPQPVAIDADAVIVAVPAAKAAMMVRDVAPAASHELGGIDSASTALITLAFDDVRLPPGSGVLVPAVDGLSVKALTFSGQKWAHLAGTTTLVRASVGRHGDVTALQRDDDELASIVATEVAAITGVSARPVDALVIRWGGALPQYAVGHLDRVRRIRAAVDDVPGLAVCGAAYDGIGVPACIRSGRLAAARIAHHLQHRQVPEGQSRA
ncbi:MAG: protoporphyrinogen oxidase [Mycobacteriales bacterium]|nr:MAG: protoporphyrinogen oxidase [Pseudonocardiales bacterium]